MILGIDASNIRHGGGETHLKEILNFAEPIRNGFSKVVIWSNKHTLSQLPNRDWLIKETHPFLEKSFVWSFVFQLFILRHRARTNNCSVLFVPGGTFIGLFRPYVTMSQNMLPFELKEAFRFKKLSVRIRFLLLRITQSSTFKRADGIIFLSNYAKASILKKLGKLKLTANIPHGINKSFTTPPKKQSKTDTYSFENPFKILYVSIITAYKHQWNVAEAICRLNNNGFPIRLTLIGPKKDESFGRLQKVLTQYSNSSNCIVYLGKVDHSELFNYYKNTDAFIFASTCENMPIILIEAMSASLPIACSNKGPMPEVLGNAGIYFNPENVEEIYLAIKELFLNQEKRTEMSKKAYERTFGYSWENCSDDTFRFLSQVGKR